jgi:hypothetical protein
VPTEVRFIVFSPDEVRNAAIAYVRKQVQEIGPSDIVTVEVAGPQDTPTAVIQVQASQTNKVIDQRLMHLDQQHLTAALILHCYERRIPLPKGADKRVELTVNGLTLVSTIDRPHGAPSISSSRVSYGELATNATNTIGTVQEQLRRAIARAEYAEKLVAQADDCAKRAQVAESKAKSALIAIAMMPGLRGRLGRRLVKFRLPSRDGSHEAVE